MTFAHLYKYWNVKGEILPLREYFMYIVQLFITIEFRFLQSSSLLLHSCPQLPLSFSHTLTHMGLGLEKQDSLQKW